VAERGTPGRPTVVLVHGWPDSKALWDYIAERLAADHHVVTYDVRGAGASSHPAERDAYRVETLVEDLAAVIDAIGGDRPVHLVGHDWGAVQGWEAVGVKAVADRLASFTSISGPSLDHSGYALRDNAGNLGGVLRIADQLVRFSYILSFATPLPGLVRRLGPRAGRAYDAAHGTQMYLANILRRLRQPEERHTDVPVQVIEATLDPVVRKASIDASEAWVTNLWRRRIRGEHWVVRTHPARIAAWIAEFVAFVETGVEPDGLRHSRVSGEPKTHL
ncbi:MAG: alpha/beta fold hydrolase, partial [Acidimicrobiales bacterium]